VVSLETIRRRGTRSAELEAARWYLGAGTVVRAALPEFWPRRVDFWPVERRPKAMKAVIGLNRPDERPRHQMA